VSESRAAEILGCSIQEARSFARGDMPVEDALATADRMEETWALRALAAEVRALRERLAAGVEVPAHIIETCANEYMLRRAEGRFGYDADDHRRAFVRGYVACAVTFAKGVDGEI